MNNLGFDFFRKSITDAAIQSGGSQSSPVRAANPNAFSRTGFSSFEPRVKIHRPGQRSTNPNSEPKKSSSGAIRFSGEEKALLRVFEEDVPPGSRFIEDIFGKSDLHASDHTNDDEIAEQKILPIRNVPTEQNSFDREKNTAGGSDSGFVPVSSPEPVSSSQHSGEAQDDQHDLQMQEMLLAIFLTLILSGNNSDLLLLISVLYIFI